jgi:nucleotide-binding universal stress UspA family protein
MEVRSHWALKRVLVPVDFSESSRKALDYALALVRPFNAEVRLLHVVEALVLPPDAEVVDLADFARALSDKAAKCLAKWREAVASEARVEEELRAGIPYREIVAAAGERNTDLIVLGTHGRTGLAGVLVGSTAERVVHQAPCPVLVTRERELSSGAA